MKHTFARLLLCLIIVNASSAYNKKPRLTVIMVVDQFAYNYLPKLSCFLKHGIKFLINHAVVYEHANYPHGAPSTGPGHTALNTGITADYHGIISNNWCDPDGDKISCDDDDADDAAVINPTGGLYDYGKGPANIMVDGITDQYVMSSQPEANRVSISISLKSRSAICTANKMGKAIWFDPLTGQFTSSKAYYEQLPSWLRQFNQQTNLARLSRISWPLYFPRNSQAYNFKEIDNYKYSARGPIAGKTLPVGGDKRFTLFERTPAANQLIFDLALHTIKTHVTRQSCQEMLLWVCLSPLDMIGHEYGPQSREAIDMIYHLDCQIEQFMDRVSDYLKRTDVLYVLTGDHGVSPIPEILQDEGYDYAYRLNYATMIPELNRIIKKELGVEQLICSCMSSQIFVKEKIFNALTPEQQEKCFALLKKNLMEYQGIKKVWTPQELLAGCWEPERIESFYKHQIFAGRTGRLIIQPLPYCVPDDFDTGTGHRTPYEPDTHVPLMLYQKHNLEKRIIYDKVWTLQLANSLAFILGIQKPSASTYPILPGLIDYDPITGEVLQTVVL